MVEHVRADKPHRRRGHGRVLVAAALFLASPKVFRWSTTKVADNPVARAFRAGINWPGELEPTYCTDMERAAGRLPAWWTHMPVDDNQLPPGHGWAAPRSPPAEWRSCSTGSSRSCAKGSTPRTTQTLLVACITPTRWDPFFTDYMTLADVYRFPTRHFHFHRHQLSFGDHLDAS